MDTDGCPLVKKRRMQKFLPEYHKRWPVLSPSDMGSHYAKCRVCGSSFSISHGGANDCAKHVNGMMHQKYAESKLGQSSIEKFCIKGNDNEHETTNAELLWTNFITEHNLPVSVSDRTNQAFCHFLAFILPVFCRANTALQFEKPLVHKSRRICMDLYRCTLLKFLKPNAFTGKALLDINVKLSYNLRSDNDIALGEATRVYLLEKNFSDSKQKELCSSVREFYQKAAIYLKEKLEPMKCELLKAVEFCDVTQISGIYFSSVRYVVEKLPPVMPKDCTIDELEAEFNLLQVEELGPFVTGAEQADVQWVRIAESVTVGMSYFIAATQQCGL